MRHLFEIICYVKNRRKREREIRKWTKYMFWNLKILSFARIYLSLLLWWSGIFFLLFLICSTLNFFHLSMTWRKKETPQKRSGESVSVWKLFCNCGIFINILITFTTFMNVGFNDATLEHHIRDVSFILISEYCTDKTITTLYYHLHPGTSWHILSPKFTVLTPTAVGGIFLVSGLIYAVCSQGWGILINRCSNAHPFVLVGYILSLGAFLLSGPMYPIPLEPYVHKKWSD